MPIIDHKATDDDATEIVQFGQLPEGRGYLVSQPGLAPTAVWFAAQPTPTSVVTCEILLAIVATELRAQQAGDGRSRESALALTRTEEALQWLHHRARHAAALATIKRRLEGTSQS